ncbi:hypothetical protein PR001_g18142 [Phytophthora rubi]|uniref:RxLR effector protein n=1 Tax=Phytophthora rubi TaxID=129364 RepID=A0A6A3JUG0_9STRA|nr:hypothetical protein PR002_g19657 [Phytophthora rubi]KAE9002828.1 hypothetical protein PR001_g18142 [Phytophthora rubi]
MSVAAAATVVITAFPPWSWAVSDAARLANGVLGPETTEARSRHVTGTSPTGDAGRAAGRSSLVVPVPGGVVPDSADTETDIAGSVPGA